MKLALAVALLLAAWPAPAHPAQWWEARPCKREVNNLFEIRRLIDYSFVETDEPYYFVPVVIVDDQWWGDLTGAERRGAGVLLMCYSLDGDLPIDERSLIEKSGRPRAILIRLNAAQDIVAVVELTLRGISFRERPRHDWMPWPLK
ncbi:MAG: hypothetical protein AB7P52_17575 [Alphaproteobacteria bacterium]